MTIRLTMAFSDNPRVQPLKDGTIKPQNIELDCITLDPSTLFYRNLFYDEFDVSEMSISETLLARERSDGSKWDWSALPVFLSRGHHWPYLYVNTGSGTANLGDLRGKRIGVPDYDMTAALWFRNTLKDLHGIEAKDNVWFNGRTKELSHGGALGLDGRSGRGHPPLARSRSDARRDARPRRDRCLHGDPSVEPGHRRRSDGHRPVGRDTDRRQPAPAQIAAGRRQGRRLRILPADRVFPGQSPRDRAEPHPARTSLGRIGAVRSLPAVEGNRL